MNRWKFSALFLSIMIVMRIIVIGTQNIHIDGIWIFIITVAINGPFTIAGYFVFKKRYDYLGYKISMFEKIIFLTMPFLWIAWIGMYFQGMFPGCCSKREKPKEDILEKLKNNALMQLPNEENDPKKVGSK